MYCVRCGRKAGNDERFCARCGMKLISPKEIEKKYGTAPVKKKANSASSRPPRIREESPAPPVRKANPPAAKKRAAANAPAVHEPPRKERPFKWLRRRLRRIRRTYRKIKRRLDFRAVLLSRRFRIGWQRFRLKTRSLWTRLTDWLRGWVQRRKKPKKTAAVRAKRPPQRSAAGRKPSAAKQSKPVKKTQPGKDEIARLRSRQSIFDDEPEIDIFKVKPRAVPEKKEPAEPQKRDATAVRSAGTAKKATAHSLTLEAPAAKKPAHRLREEESRDKTRKKRPPSSAASSSRRPEGKSSKATKKRRPEEMPKRPNASPQPSARTSAKNARRPAQKRGKPVPPRPRYRRYEEESFFEKHLRSLIAMILLVITVIVMLTWSMNSYSGQRLLAQLGLGGAEGYIILGDECMESGNYARAVEHYYKALTKETEYDSAIKLARAYRQTGDTEREVSALLLCIDRFESNREPYERLKELYPVPSTRPVMVKDALFKGVTIFSDITLAY